jgi:hypothetical protein
LTFNQLRDKITYDETKPQGDCYEPANLGFPIWYRASVSIMIEAPIPIMIGPSCTMTMMELRIIGPAVRSHWRPAKRPSTTIFLIE